MQSILERIYGREKGGQAFSRLTALMKDFPPVRPARDPGELFSPSDAVLITYGDSLLSTKEPPLQTLHRFAREWLAGVFSGIHVLPFFPYSSDDGFSVTDFLAVRPDLGTWEDIRALAGDFGLMADLVANHVSARSGWFRRYLAGEKGFTDLAIEVDPAADLSAVVRPRALPLLTAFEKASGSRVHLWTTFSADQIDLNYRGLDVLERMVRALLFYVSQGARIIRLDAIAYLWKEIGTPCIHLPETHDMVRLFRAILEHAAPGTILITETNVPHDENIRYFGSGRDEAHMVYNFTLPPLLLHALATADARILSGWAKTLKTPSPQTAFFNFTASHDGIGVRPLEGILTPSEIDRLADRVVRNGGKVSSRRRSDGSESPYELNITYLDALKSPEMAQDPFHVSRFLASQAVALALPGVPAVYIHSFLGSRNWAEGVRRTGRARSINREKLSAEAVLAELADPLSLRARIFHPYRKMLRIRTRQPAFHPTASARVLDLDRRVFALERTSAEQTLLALTNLSQEALSLFLPPRKGGHPFIDLLSPQAIPQPEIPMPPYATRWLSDLD